MYVNGERFAGGKTPVLPVLLVLLVMILILGILYSFKIRECFKRYQS